MASKTTNLVVVQARTKTPGGAYATARHRGRGRGWRPATMLIKTLHRADCSRIRRSIWKWDHEPQAGGPGADYDRTCQSCRPLEN